MPYLPLPPAQPPAIVQTLSPEETSSAPSTTSASSKSDRVPFVQAQAPTPTPTTVSSPASLAPPLQALPKLNDQGRSSAREAQDASPQPASFTLPTSDQSGVASSSYSKKPTGTVAPQPASPAHFAEPEVTSSARNRVSQKFGAASSTSKPETSDLSASPERSEQIFMTQSQSTPNLWELTPSHAVSSQVSNKGGTKQPLKFHPDSPEYKSIRQVLTATGSALLSSGLASEMGLEAFTFRPLSNLESPKTSKVHNLQSPPVRDTAATSAVGLLKHYGFEAALTAEQLADQWQKTYPSDWIHSALIEALYQGRYKAVSVEKILAAWQRRGQPLYHFDQEFERLVYAQSQKTSERAGYDDPVNRLDIKSPSPASLLEPVAQASPIPAPSGDSPPEIPRDRGGSTQKNLDGEFLELYADRQEYDDVRRIFTAVGNVLLRFQGATLRANQLQVNLQTQLATAEGNISLTRGEQRLQGDRLEYNYVQNQGSFANARGEIYLPTASTDLSATDPTGEPTGFPTDDDQTGTDDINPDGQPLSEEIQQNQPRQVQTTAEIQRLRFEAERIEFNARGWEAQDIRITNDPFSPPELEVRADEARLVRVSSLEDRGEATRPRLVFDRGLSLPILRSRVRFDRRERDPAIAQFGFDNSERGGFFVGRTLEPLLTDQTSLTITPQFFLQRAVETSNFNVVDPDLYGLNVRLNSTLSPTTSLTGAVILTSFDPTDISDNLRANLRLRRPVETLVGTHRLVLEYAYRDRVYNGSLGFQDIQNSLGAILTSPTISLGNTGIDLNYQVGTQYITAETEQFGGLPDPASLGRFQASASLRRGFYLWQGQALPATATAGLRYTPEPVVPYLQLFTGLTGIANAYTSGDTQETLLGRVGIQGQFGHFSRPFLDYTGFNISYSQIGLLGLSPFLFDRVTDFKVLSAGIVQQIYGPIRAGVQVALSLDTGEAFDIEYLLEYNRRTYGVFLRYNPSRQIGSINFQLSGFNWTGGTAPFSEPERP